MALSDVSFDVPAGQFLSIVGPSGCGKSTLLAMVAGLDQPTEGAVSVGGKRLHGTYTEAGVVFQKDLLLAWRSALDNILLQFEMRGVKVTSEHRRNALQLLERVGIERFADSYPHQLSGGMRQRVAICRALVHDPSILLLDEPMGALDPITREQLNLDLSALVSRGAKTAILVTHSIEEAVFLGDRVLVMSAGPGRVVADIKVEVERPRADWPGAGARTDLDVYVKQVRDALLKGGAYRHA
jgi:NitT/TauT family transport system ATP-binding protein